MHNEESKMLFGGKKVKVRNMAIAYYYHHGLNRPSSEEWTGKNGVIIDICRVFKIGTKKRRQVKLVLEAVNDSILKGKKYDGRTLRTGGVGGAGGRHSLIIPGSTEECIIADWME